VRQHILDVVNNVIYCFVGNLTDFPAVKNFENRLRFDKIIVRIEWRVFETQCTFRQYNYDLEQYCQRLLVKAALKTLDSENSTCETLRGHLTDLDVILYFLQNI